MEALLIVDVQNDFLPGGALAVPQADQVIPVINSLQKVFACIIASKDWHPSHHISFASSHIKKTNNFKIKRLKQPLWPDHCIQGTQGAEFPKLLNTMKIKKIFFKGTNPNIDSYSAFYDNAHLCSTGLNEYLRESGIDSIYIVGLAIDYCVKYTVLDASKLGLKIHVIIDGCRGINLKPNDVEQAILEMEVAGAKITNSKQVLAQFEFIADIVQNFTF